MGEKNNPKNKVLERITDFNNNSMINIICDQMYYHTKNYKKLNVYNKGIKEPLQKLWLRLPQLKVFKPVITSLGKYKNVKSLPLFVMLSPLTGKTKKFVSFIKKLENKVERFILQETGRNLKPRSSINSNDNLPDTMMLKMPFEKGGSCVDFSFHIYNGDNKRVSLDVIDSGTNVSAFIELSDVWIGKEEFGFNWNILQLKVYPEYNFNKCMFIDDEYSQTNSSDNNETSNECYHCLYCPNNHIRTHCCLSSFVSPSNSPIASSIPTPPPLPPMTSLSNTTASNIKSAENPTLIKYKNDELTYNISPEIRDERESTKFSKSDQHGNFVPTIDDLLKVKLKPVTKSDNKEGLSSGSDWVPSLKDILNAKQRLKTLSHKPEDKRKNKKNLKKINKEMEMILLDIELDVDNYSNGSTDKEYYDLMKSYFNVAV